MDTPVKAIVSSRKALADKYGEKGFAEVAGLLRRLVEADRKRRYDTRIILIDDAASAGAAGIGTVRKLTQRSAKQAVDAVHRRLSPAYIMILGAQDVFPFQEVANPVADDDPFVPSDLPYACDAPQGKGIHAYTGPTRIVSRLPDIPGDGDPAHLRRLVGNILRHRTAGPEAMKGCFAVTAREWKRSTRASLANVFGDAAAMRVCPPDGKGYTKKRLAPLLHFYNCHGAPSDASYYGEWEGRFPEAQASTHLVGKVSAGTVVAAECCYGAEVFHPGNDDRRRLSIPSTYLAEGAIAFMGSTTVAYGPPEGQALADIITQQFLLQVRNGASTGRALLTARQQFLTQSGPQLDGYELKTLAQFLLLGDPSLTLTEAPASADMGDSIANRRLNLRMKGMGLARTIEAAQRVQDGRRTQVEKTPSEVRHILRQLHMKGDVEETVHRIDGKQSPDDRGMEKKRYRPAVTYTSYIQRQSGDKGFGDLRVVVVKKEDGRILGWREYRRK